MDGSTHRRFARLMLRKPLVQKNLHLKTFSLYVNWTGNIVSRPGAVLNGEYEKRLEEGGDKVPTPPLPVESKDELPIPSAL